jgi:DNA-binding PadR family transcriptional regulator
MSIPIAAVSCCFQRAWKSPIASLYKVWQEGYVAAEWGVSDNNRRAKYYSLTRAGKRQLEKEARQWEQTTTVMDRFFSPGEEIP